MMENLLWWHWIILGIVLVAGEVIIPGAVVVWFGLAALVVGGLNYFYPMEASLQLYIWSGLSLGMLLLYRALFKPTAPITSVGQSQSEYADIPGIIVAQKESNRYKARFDLPVLGDREWIVESENGLPLEIGQHVKVTQVHGQLIKVKGV
ncbi:MAG: NfeD family protein [Epsilonproteobacteria bacterium]|nr:NfeD family protein [Campylobacterota bacterium]